MTDHPAISTIVTRLVAEPPPEPGGGPRRPRRRLYRPLAVGPVVLRRSGDAGRWLARVSADGRLLPRRSALAANPRAPMATDLVRRLAVALVTPHDLAGERPLRVAEHHRSPAEFYGWALMVQFPGMRGVAAVDPHERFADLPAFYESPLELLDRASFLAARGIPSRPIAVITRPEDFVLLGGQRRNRFYPGERFRPAVDFDRPA